MDSSFWGPCSQVALLDGTGSVTFDACEFVQWDLQKKDGRAAIRATGSPVRCLRPVIFLKGGSVVLQGNEFLDSKKQVELGSGLIVAADVADLVPGVKKAVIIGNLANGKQQIDNQCKNTQIGLNAWDL